jgi:ABC-type transport system substrate-binding protein
MPHRDRAIILAFVVALCVLAVGILLPVAAPGGLGIGSGPSPSPSPSPVVEQDAYRDGIVGRPTSITPLTARTRADRDLVELVFRGLVRLGPGQTLGQDLADSWTVGEGGKTYTFTIRPDATWHDGVSVTAEDVVFTVEMLKDPEYTGAAGASWSDVTAEAVDGRTVQFTLGKPIGGFLQLATQPLLPAHLLRDVKAKDLADSPYARDPVGNGPYRIVERDLDHATLVPVDDYAAPPEPTLAPSASPAASGEPSASPDRSVSPDEGASTAPDESAPAASGEPAASAAPSAAPTADASPGSSGDVPVDLAASGLARIDLRFYDDEAALAAAFAAGDLDAASGVDPATAADLVAGGGARLVKYPSAIFTSLTFNLRPDHPKFMNRHFRRAIVEAVDRKALVGDLLGGGGTIAETPIPPSSWAFSAAASAALPHDLDKATAELEVAGWKKGAKGWVAPKATTPFTLEILALDELTNPLSFAVATRVAKDLTDFGIRTKVVGLARSVLVQRLRDHDFDAVLLDANVGLDPDPYPLLASTQAGPDGSNISGIQNGELDVLLADARKPGSMAARKKRYATLQTDMTKEQYMPPLYFRDYLVVYRDTVDGPHPRELGDLSDRYWDVLTWRLATSR